MGKQIIGINGMVHIGGLERHFHIGEANVFQGMHGIERRFGQRLGGEGNPYFSSRGRSNDPPLTPTAQGEFPRSLTALMTSCTFHHGPILPGIDADTIDDFSGF